MSSQDVYQVSFTRNGLAVGAAEAAGLITRLGGKVTVVAVDKDGNPWLRFSAEVSAAASDGGKRAQVRYPSYGTQDTWAAAVISQVVSAAAGLAAAVDAVFTQAEAASAAGSPSVFEPRKPAKPWRVETAGADPVRVTSEQRAYAAAKPLTEAGATATIRHWEKGRWVKFEVLSPETVWPD